MGLNFNSFIAVVTPESDENIEIAVEHVVTPCRSFVHLWRIEIALDISISTTFSVARMNLTCLFGFATVQNVEIMMMSGQTRRCLLRRLVDRTKD